MGRNLRTWLPVAVVPAVVIIGALTVPLQAGAAVDLPDKTPAQVLAMIGDSSVQALSGTIEQTSELGLPELPSAGTGSGSNAGTGASASASSALELLTGSHTARIYVDGPDNLRVQIMDRLAERDLVRNATDLWMYNSKDNTALHVALPDPVGMTGPSTDSAQQTPAQQTPAQLAERMLAAIDPSTAVSVGKDTRVAGRTAYELRLTPRTDETLVGEVSIAVDSETGMPLRVEVLARGQSAPAFSLAYSTLSLTAPDADRFEFTPPAGASVEEKALPDASALHEKMSDAAMPGIEDGKMPTTKAEAKALAEQFKSGGGMLPGVSVAGTGWASVVELPAGTVSADVLADPMLAQVTESVDGGRLLSSALINVLVTDDGRVFAGSVPSARLQAAAVGG
ncbi:sigma-E factor regulatory protein RseB domain-containing protein [Cryobacterium sp. PH31-AA6]|uniref:LolA family protein n=1 Tax=Cryobacterium sp. PH31-AA6 TaxID=3046205 RepID=UPI0024B89579|nr:sigma-E factor regulatory protein RseB domain-containing protein [Cryobacterium sp. PH31-AA6]MDJ0323248.1 sigma-E factor regulatory protein RseB domain-containing protein [Cryobacterium sp. PH31-AA6]